MPEVNPASVFYPPQFPVQGRLPGRPEKVEENILIQCERERKYKDAACLAAGYNVTPPCCKTLHVSLFFDGTGNNLNNDLYQSAIPHPTNVARLFRASIGAGYAGGTATNASIAKGLMDRDGVGNGQYFKYYMPGVGTPFPEVGDLDYSTGGLAYARYGEERINWGLLMIFDALRRTLGEPRMGHGALKDAVMKMGTKWGSPSSIGRSKRSKVIREQVELLKNPLINALRKVQGKSTLLGVELYIYGFSRGAATARAFVSWLNDLLSVDPYFKLRVGSDSALSISVKYLGLFDTVASVGVADLAPGADGHMGWGDETQRLPKSKLVKRCLHIIASHEQRLSFPSESIRYEDGSYPGNSEEVIYPGVHSDQGGGYPPGDQGKAVGSSDRYLLSQIALHDLYADAFAHGAPLKVPEDVLPPLLRGERWRAMNYDLTQTFRVASTLVNRFNAWRQVTLGLPNAPQPLPAKQAELYHAIKGSMSLEAALRSQLAWITAWRIDRYAFLSLKGADFYREASDVHSEGGGRKNAEIERNRKQGEIAARRENQKSGSDGWPLPEPGIPTFDPDIGKSQLIEAANEFRKTYQNLNNDPYILFLNKMKYKSPAALVTYLNSATTRSERERMRAAGRAKVSRLFPPPEGQKNHFDEKTRGNVDERLNIMQPEGLLRALFDDHVHDSRAWFLHSDLNRSYWRIPYIHVWIKLPVSMGREPWGSYFNERNVFFGNLDRRGLGAKVDNEPRFLVVGGNQHGADIVASDHSVTPTQEDSGLVQAQKNIDSHWGEYYARTHSGDYASA